jgi:hypothetical protein
MALLRGYVSGVEREDDRTELWQQKERQNNRANSFQSPSQTTRTGLAIKNQKH